MRVYVNPMGFSREAMLSASRRYSSDEVQRGFYEFAESIEGVATPTPPGVEFLTTYWIGNPSRAVKLVLNGSGVIPYEPEVLHVAADGESAQSPPTELDEVGPDGLCACGCGINPTEVTK